MKCPPPHRSRLRRVLVACGLVFVGAGILGLIAYQELELPRPQQRSPVILAGRLFTRAPGIETAGVLVHFRRPNEPLQPGRRRYVETAVTDRSGYFSFDANFRGPAHLFLDRHRMRDWTYRPIAEIALPSSQVLQIELIEGSIAAGRVVRNGVPAAGIGICLKFVEPAAHEYFYLFQEATDDQGRFRFEHLPEGAEFWISALRTRAFEPQLTDALPDDQTFPPIRFRTGADRTTIELGDFKLRSGATLAGRVVVSDGKAIPENWVVAAGRPGAGGRVYSRLDKKGHFQIKGLPPGTIAAHVEQVWTINPPGYPVPVPGYRPSARNKCLDPSNGFELIGQLDDDTSDLTILLEPTTNAAGAGAGGRPSSPDPAALAQFRNARAGPITGAAAIP
ncbi:MAG: carboxypeptidase-like regulatory domain-containing protein [Isosphaeraceae bacterium]